MKTDFWAWRAGRAICLCKYVCEVDVSLLTHYPPHPLSRDSEHQLFRSRPYYFIFPTYVEPTNVTNDEPVALHSTYFLSLLLETTRDKQRTLTLTTTKSISSSSAMASGLLYALSTETPWASADFFAALGEDAPTARSLNAWFKGADWRGDEWALEAHVDCLAERPMIPTPIGAIVR